MLVCYQMAKFSNWLTSIMIERKLTASDVARKSKKAPAVIGRILNDEREPAPKTIMSICEGLGIPVEEGFRAAGYLPPKAEAEEKVERGKYTLENYKSPQNQDRALEFLEFLRQQEEQGNFDVKPDQKKHKNNESLPRLSTLNKGK
jgi:transcriptional regulator with XRE-family HTH domain